MVRQTGLLFGFVALLAASVSSEETKKAGPFDIQLDEVGQCDDKGNGEITLENLMLKMTSKNVMEVSFDGTNKVPFDDNITVTAEVSSYDAEKQIFGPKVMKIPVGPVCKAFNTFFPKTVKKFFDSIGVEGCPVPPNTWHVKKFPFVFALPVSSLPYKKVRSDVVFKKDGATVLCTRVLFSILPEGSVTYPPPST